VQVLKIGEKRLGLILLLILLTLTCATPTVQGANSTLISTVSTVSTIAVGLAQPTQTAVNSTIIIAQALTSISATQVTSTLNIAQAPFSQQYYTLPTETSIAPSLYITSTQTIASTSNIAPSKTTSVKTYQIGGNITLLANVYLYNQTGYLENVTIPNTFYAGRENIVIVKVFEPYPPSAYLINISLLPWSNNITITYSISSTLVITQYVFSIYLPWNYRYDKCLVNVTAYFRNATSSTLIPIGNVSKVVKVIYMTNITYLSPSNVTVHVGQIVSFRVCARYFNSSVPVVDAPVYVNGSVVGFTGSDGCAVVSINSTRLGVGKFTLVVTVPNVVEPRVVYVYVIGNVSKPTILPRATTFSGIVKIPSIRLPRLELLHVSVPSLALVVASGHRYITVSSVSNISLPWRAYGNITILLHSAVIYLRKIVLLGKYRITIANLTHPRLPWVLPFIASQKWNPPIIGGAMPSSWFRVYLGIYPTNDTVQAWGRYYAGTGYATGAVVLVIPARRVVPIVNFNDFVMIIGNLRAVKLRIGHADWSDLFNAWVHTVTLASAPAITSAVALETGLTGGAGVAFLGLFLTGTAVVIGLSQYRVGMYVLPLILVRDVKTGTVYALGRAFISKETYNTFWKSPYFSNFIQSMGKYLAKYVLNTSNVTVILEPVIVAKTDRELELKLLRGTLRDIVLKQRMMPLIYEKLIVTGRAKLSNLQVIGGVLFVGFYLIVERGVPNVEKSYYISLQVSNLKIDAIASSGTINGTALCHFKPLPIIVTLGNGQVPVPENNYTEYCKLVHVNGMVFAMWNITFRPSLVLTDGEGLRLELSGLTTGAEAEYADIWLFTILSPCRCNLTTRTCVCGFHSLGYGRLREIALLNMPAPAVLVERTFVYRYGRFRNIVYINKTWLPVLRQYFDNDSAFLEWERVGNMFHIVYIGRKMVQIGNKVMNMTVIDLGTVKNTKWIDPTNGGTLEKCKRFIFRYFFGTPPDVGIELLFNGTSRVATQPIHLTVRLVSNVGQVVTYRLRIAVLWLNYTTHRWNSRTLLDKTYSVYVPANGTRLVIYDVVPFIEQALEYARRGYPTMLLAEAWILKASVGDYFKSNDYDNETFPILPTLVNISNRPGLLIVHVFNVLNREPIPNATVHVYEIRNGTRLVETCLGLTNASGVFVCNITRGLVYLISVVAVGYRNILSTVIGNETYSGVTVLAINRTTIVYYPLAPASALLNKSSVGNWTRGYTIIRYRNVTYVSLVVEVVYNDSTPVPGANVTIINASSGTVTTSAVTDSRGIAIFYIRNGTEIRVQVTAVARGRTYRFSRTLLLTKPTWLVFTLPMPSPLFRPEVAVLNVKLLVHTGVTWLLGKVPHLVQVVLYSNIRQRIVLEIVLYRQVNGTWVSVETRNVSLTVFGLVPYWTWFNITLAGKYRVLAKIVKYEKDTDLRNNVAWSNVATLLPFIVVEPILRVVPVRTKMRYFILPGDVVRLVIALRYIANVHIIHTWLRITVMGHGYGTRMLLHEKYSTVLHVHRLMWMNMTNLTSTLVEIPWKHLLEINITVGYNYAGLSLGERKYTYRIVIDPDVALIRVNYPRVVTENSRVRICATVRNNVPNGVATVETWGFANASRRVRLTRENVTTCLTVKVPPNPRKHKWFITIPVAKVSRRLTVYVYSPTDVYPPDNTMNITMTVLAVEATHLAIGFATLLALLAVLLLIIVIVTKLARSRKVRTRIVGDYVYV